MNLLDPKITHYVMHEKTWKFGGGEILDTDGNKIGIMKRKIISLRADIELRNTDETPVCIISKKLAAVRPIYDVKTPDGQLIGRAKKPLIAFRGSVDMYDPQDNLIFKAQGGISKSVIRRIRRKCMLPSKNQTNGAMCLHLRSTSRTGM